MTEERALPPEAVPVPALEFPAPHTQSKVPGIGLDPRQDRAISEHLCPPQEQDCACKTLSAREELNHHQSVM